MTIPYAPTSWNPVVGCEPVSEGCKNCWAMKLHTQRHNANCHVAAGAVMGRLPAPKARAGDLPLPMPAQYDLPFSHIQLFPARLEEPLHWRKPRTVAICFMADLFHPQVPDEFIDRVFATMAICGARRQTCRSGTRCQHEEGESRGCWHYGDGFDWPTQTFVLLTKRADRMHAYLTNEDVLQRIHDVGNDPEWHIGWEDPYEMIGELGWPLPNVWLGVTAENQHWADERIPLLLDTPGKHWVSLEPLLGPVDLTRWLPLHPEADRHCGQEWPHKDHTWPWPEPAPWAEWKNCPGSPFDPAKRLDGVVVGGESGPGHRPMELRWAASLYEQCRAAKVDYYFKQIAASRPGQRAHVGRLDSAKGLPWTR